jgi:5-methylcytosine-specific restriction enzyme A
LIASVLPIEMATFRHPDEVLGYPEGAVSKVLVNRYERDPRNRREAIAIHGKSCLACNFNFQEKYGELGDEYIVVHHTVPVSQMGNDYVVDPAKDLVTLCANCHAMVHRHDPPISVSDLRKILSD